MTTIDLMDFTGATVRIAYVGQGVINEQRRDLSGKMCYAVDIPLNGRNARVWRYPRDIQVIALRRTIKTKPRPTVSLFHNYMEFSATKPVDVIAPTPTLIDVNKPLETQEQAVIAEIVNNHPDLIERDNASPEPRPLVVVAPVLRLFTARVVTPMLEMVA